MAQGANRKKGMADGHAFSPESFFPCCSLAEGAFGLAAGKSGIPGYSMLMALTGHSSTQAPQSTQASETLALPFSITIASVGQESTQASQPVQVFLSTTAGMGGSPCWGS
jgi:hypothetical protein